MNDLFDSAGVDARSEKLAHRPRRAEALQPLADRLRPQTLEEIVGQDHLLGPDGAITRMIAAGGVRSLVLWGPPGVGKTTIARLLADAGGLAYDELSAVFSGVADLRKAFDRARAQAGRGVLLFVDEIHRFNKAQQDGFLPAMETGLIVLVGATTENPSFELNAALLSRAQVFVLHRLDEAAIETLLSRAEQFVGAPLPVTAPARARLVEMSAGDGRYVLNLAEAVYAAVGARLQSARSSSGVGDDSAAERLLNTDELARLVAARAPGHDKRGDAHYDLASALQKSIRGSDVDAALYWAARMLEGGEDPNFVLRRLTVVASEDVGNADPHALPLAISVRDAFAFLGRPEGDIAIGQLVAYLASAPKSNRAHVAFKRAKALARETSAAAPPPHALNAPTQLMKSIGRSEGYVYDHDAPGGFAGLDYFPPDLPRTTLYEPRDVGAERAIAARLSVWRAERAGRAPSDPAAEEKERAHDETH